MNIEDMCKAAGLTEKQIKTAVLFPRNFGITSGVLADYGKPQPMPSFQLVPKKTGFKRGEFIIQTAARADGGISKINPDPNKYRR